MSHDVNGVKTEQDLRTQARQVIIDLGGNPDLYAYQVDIICDEEVITTHKPVVIGASVSAGKTTISSALMKLYHTHLTNHDKVSFVFPSTTKQLRNQWEKKLDKLGLKYAVIKSGTRGNTVRQQLEAARRNGVQVILSLPQTLRNVISYLPKNIGQVFFDEAHKWWFKTLVQSIVARLNPRHTYLLTGSPYKFNARKNDFCMRYVTSEELLKLGVITDIEIEVVSTAYDYDRDDYYHTGALKKGMAHSTKIATAAMGDMLEGMLKRLKSLLPFRSIGNLTDNNLSKLFGWLDKTIIYCDNTSQAKKFETYLKKRLGDKAVRRSDSKNDTESVFFDEFYYDNDIRILIAVDRGREGFDMSELCHVVDFTLTQNLTVIGQMKGRIMRKSIKNPNKRKFYFKAAPARMADYFVDLMLASLALGTREWYTTYDEKNLKDIIIPKVLLTNPNRKGKRKVGGGGKGPGVKTPSIPLDIPLSLSGVWETYAHMRDNPFGTIASTTLGKAYAAFFGIMNYYRTWDDIVPTFDGFQGMHEWRMANRAAASWAARNNLLDKIYQHTGWNSGHLTLKTFEQHILPTFDGYDNFSEWRKNNGYAYTWLRKNNQMDKLFAHNPTWKSKRNVDKSIDRMIPTFSGHSSFIDWKKNNPKLEKFARTHNLLEEIYNYTGWKPGNNRTRTFESVLETTKGFESVFEWSKAFQAEYIWARTRNLIDKIRSTNNWVTKTWLGRKHTEETIKKISEAKKGRSRKTK